MNCSYENFDINSIELLIDILKDDNIKGLNVTIPYKESIFKYLNNIDPVAIQIFTFEIRWYSLAYIAGILIGWILSKK